MSESSRESSLLDMFRMDGRVAVITGGAGLLGMKLRSVQIATVDDRRKIQTMPSGRGRTFGVRRQVVGMREIVAAAVDITPSHVRRFFPRRKAQDAAFQQTKTG